MPIEQTVTEYPLEAGDEHRLWISGSGVRMLTARVVGDGIVLLVLAGGTSEKHPVNIRIVRTGEPVSGMDRLTYLATVHHGGVDCHVFYDIPF